jgi:hypothetical protein
VGLVIVITAVKKQILVVHGHRNQTPGTVTGALKKTHPHAERDIIPKGTEFLARQFQGEKGQNRKQGQYL